MFGAMRPETKAKMAEEAKKFRYKQGALHGLVIMTVGLFAIIVGIILIAAFGLPDNVSEHPKQIASVVMISSGLIIVMVGVGCIVKKKRAEEQGRAKIEQYKTLEKY